MTTKTLTPADAIEAAERKVANAVLAEEEATRALDALKLKIRTDGPAAVSAEELLTATARADHAKLGTGHAQQILADAHKAAATAHANALAAEILDGTGHADDVTAAIAKVAEGVSALMTICARRDQTIHRGIGQMRAARINSQTAGGPVVGVGRLAWSNANMGHGDLVHVDGRQIGSVHPGILIGAGIARGCEDSGQSIHSLAPVIQVQPGNTDPAAFVRHAFTGDRRG